MAEAATNEVASQSCVPTPGKVMAAFYLLMFFEAGEGGRL